MIERVTIENFRCLKQVDLTLEPLTIVIGPNASGKTALLDALNPTASYSSRDSTWRYREELTINREFWDKKGGKFSPTDSSGRSFEGLDLRDAGYSKLQLDLGSLRSTNTAKRAAGLDRDGSNLTNVFSTLSRDDQISVRDEFCELVPVYSDINVEPVSSGTLQLKFHDRWDPDVVYTPHQVSDGTILVLAYLVLQYQESAPAIVAVEEPERALHPYLLEQLVGFFRDLAEGRRGPEPFNMVLATHSAELLDFARPEEVRLLDRDPETGETTVDQLPYDDPDWDSTMEAYLDSLGSAWLSGGLGGVPGAG